MRTPAPTGGFDGPSQCDRTGAHYPQGARRIRKAVKPPTAALCAPLQVYDQRHRKHGGLCGTTNSEATSKSRRQVERRRQSGSGHLSSLLLTFGLCQKSIAPGATPPESWKHQRSNKPTVAAIQNVPSNDHIPAQIEVRLHIIGVVRVVQNPIAVPLYLHPRIGL